MLAADGLLRKLEGLGDLKYIANFKATRLNKVLKAAIKSSHVPSNDSWMIKRRMHLLLTGYRRCLDAATAAATGQVAAAEITAEDSENTIDLPKTSPETFANFVHWMYKQKFESSQTSEDGTFPALTPLQFVHLYVLAAHLQNAKLQNLIADSLRPIAPPSTALREMITYVSAHPTRGSKLLSLVVRMYAQRALAQEMRDAAAEWMGKEFVVELAAVLLTDRAKGRTARTQLVGEPCEYHVHDKDNPPCAESG